MVDGEVAGHRVSSFRSGGLVRRGSAATRYNGKNQAFDDDRLRYSTTLGDACPPRPNRQVGQRQGSGCSACAGPVAGGSHEASEPGQKGFERHVLAASELRCPGVQPWQDGLGRTKAKTRTGGSFGGRNGVHGEGRNSDVEMAKGREPREARLAGRGGLEGQERTAQCSTGSLGSWDGQRVRAFDEQQQQQQQ